MPPELDDLINSIREEASRESALAVYEGTRQDDLVDEEIDERILNLIGLDDTFDIDYKTYMTLLKERMAAARMTKSQIPTEESELITEEFKRVKRKTGRFKVKKKKISVQDFQKSVVKPSKLLTRSTFANASTDESKKENTPRKKKVDDIIKIRETVVSIKNLLEKRNDQLKDSAETERSRAQKARRAKKEDKLEEKKPNLGLKALEKAVAPVKGLFDRIVSGLVALIAGRFLVKFLDWFSDPDNADKVDSVIEFLTDFAPAILASFLLFGTGFGRVIRKVIGVAVKMTARLLKFAIPKLLKFVAKNPVAAAAIGVGGAAIVAGTMQSNNKSDDSDASGTESSKADSYKSGGLVPFKGDDSNLTKEQKGQQQKGQQKEKKTDNPLLSLFGKTPTGMAIKGANKGISSFGSSIKEKGLGNAAIDLAGGAFGNIKDFMDEKGMSNALMEHPLAKMAALGLGKGKEEFANLKGFMDEKGITDSLMAHPLAKIGMFGMDKTMNFGKDPARDITGNSGTDIKGAGVDTQLISANTGDVVINKKAASAVGPNYFDAISQKSGEKVTGAGPDTQMIAVRPGEIVVNKETVDSVGADHFLGLNKMFGGAGANKPKSAKVQTASGGGVVLPTFSSGGMVAPGEQRQKSLTAESVGLSKGSSKEQIESAYDEKHGEGSYDKKLKKEQSKAGLSPVGSLSPKSSPSGGSSEKGLFTSSSKSLEATLAREDAAVEAALAKVQEKSTGKVVGRENLPAATQKRLAEMDAKRSGTLPPDIKTTKKGGMPDMGLGGLIRGVLGTGDKQKEEKKYGANLADGVSKVMGAIQNPLSIFGMFGGGEKKIVDGNIGKPTAQEQKDLDNLAASKEKLKQSQQKLMGIKDSQQKPAVDYDSMDIKELNSFLDPTKTGASMPHVFEAAKAAKAQARAQGLPEEEVQRLGQVAAVKAKMGDGAKSPVKATTVKEKSSQDDSALRAEYNKIQDDPKHPLFEKVRGGYDVDDFGMRFSEFKDFKAKESAKESAKEKVKSTFQLAGSSEVIDLNKPMGSEIKRKDFPSTRSGAKAYQDAMRNMKAGAKASVAPEQQKKKESVDARHAQLMKSTDPQKIADYDAKNGKGSYSKKLLGKLKNTYADASDADIKKIVGKDMIKSKAKTFVAGEVKENSGQDLKGKTADRQRIDAEPGEYVLPKESVQKLGGPDKIDNVVANTDPNSTPAKMGEKSVTLQPPSAPSRKPTITNLPPTVQKSGGGGGDSGGGMEIAGNNPPSIPMLSNPTRERNKMIYGINEGG